MPVNPVLAYRDIRPLELPPESRILLDHPSQAVLYYDMTLGYFGAIQIWHGVAEVWARLTPKAQYHLRTIIRELPYKLEQFQKQHKWHKMYCHCKPKDLRFAEKLGFERVGFLPNRAPDGDDYYSCDYVGVR